MHNGLQFVLVYEAITFSLDYDSRGGENNVRVVSLDNEGLLSPSEAKALRLDYAKKKKEEAKKEAEKKEQERIDRDSEQKIKEKAMKLPDYYTIGYVNGDVYTTDIRSNQFIGITKNNLMAYELEDIHKFVQVTYVEGYYSDIIGYHSVNKKGKYKGVRECGCFGDTHQILINGKCSPSVGGDHKAFFIKKDVHCKQMFKTDYLGVGKDGYVVNDITLVDKFMRTEYSALGHYYYKFRPGQITDRAVLLREIKADNNG